jgi:hypothetical protein
LFEDRHSPESVSADILPDRIIRAKVGFGKFASHGARSCFCPIGVRNRRPQAHHPHLFGVWVLARDV